MVDEMMIGPVILDSRKTVQNYRDFLPNGLPELDDVPLATRIAMYFQHDGVPSHFTRLVMQHFNGIFPNRWNGRGSTLTGHQDLQA
jgi:hypothetical protein